MASFELAISATAERQLRKLGQQDRIRILRGVLRLAQEPYPRGCRKLTGFDDVYRIRVGIYRVVYSVNRRRIVVVILKVGHRKDVYR